MLNLTVYASLYANINACAIHTTGTKKEAEGCVVVQYSISLEY